jgi:dTMP kinase
MRIFKQAPGTIDDMFFSFDGLDGAGKTTQIDLFCDWLLGAGHALERCVDPGSTPLGQRVRGILLEDRSTRIDGTAEMLLFMAARAQLVDEVIRPALGEGRTVVCDRYLLANVVYQGHAGGLDPADIWSVGKLATRGILPDLTFVLDLPPRMAAERLARPLDRMETRGVEFQERLRAGFLAEAARQPRAIAVVDASRSIADVQAEIRRRAEPLLRKLP